VTTEGGLDLIISADRVTDTVRRLKAVGVFVSAFIDPEELQIHAAQQQGFDAVELHTGEYANARPDEQMVQLGRLERAGEWVREHGLRLHAGHGLNYRNVQPGRPDRRHARAQHRPRRREPQRLRRHARGGARDEAPARREHPAA
jgi:pyridoxine 5-phosphate synthase